MSTEQRITQLFDLLNKWRSLPNYQLERRADIFFALYLQDILRHKYKANDFDLIVPEFPLRYGSIPHHGDEDEGKAKKHKKANLSAKVDYLCLDRERGVCLLLELKTEEWSVKKDQFANMKRAVTAGYPALLNGVRELLQHSKEKAKYRKLLADLETESAKGMISVNGRKPKRFRMRMAVIKPTDSRPDWLPEEVCDMITFEMVIDALKEASKPTDHLTHAFMRALENWKEPLGR